LGEDDELDLEFKELGVFEKTLNNLAGLRSKAKSLPDDQRRQLAAQVALSFLESLADDDD